MTPFPSKSGVVVDAEMLKPALAFYPVLNWFCPAQWVKPGLNRIKPGLSGQNWVKHNNVHYVSSSFLPDPVCSKQYSALCLIFHSTMYPQIDLKWINK